MDKKSKSQSFPTEIDWSFTNSIIDAYESRGINALILFEKKEKSAVAYEQISKETIANFIIDFFIKNPDVYDNVMEIIENIELTDEDMDKATIH